MQSLWYLLLSRCLFGLTYKLFLMYRWLGCGVAQDLGSWALLVRGRCLTSSRQARDFSISRDQLCWVTLGHSPLRLQGKVQNLQNLLTSIALASIYLGRGDLTKVVLQSPFLPQSSELSGGKDLNILTQWWPVSLILCCPFIWCCATCPRLSGRGLALESFISQKES